MIDFKKLLERTNANKRTPRRECTYQCTECLGKVTYDVGNWGGTAHYRLGYSKPCKKGILVPIGCHCEACFRRWYVERTHVDATGVLRFNNTRLDVMYIGKSFERNGKLGEPLKAHPKLSADDIVLAGHLFVKASNT